MQTIGRNDPCPCGSGKKYKKCCQLKVQRILAEDLEYTKFLNKRTGIKDKLVEKALGVLGISEYDVLDFLSDSVLFKNRNINNVYPLDKHYLFFNILINSCRIYAFPIKNEKMFLWQYCLENFPDFFDDTELKYLKSIKNSKAGFYSVRQTDTATSETIIEDILTQKIYTLKDRKLSHIAVKHDIFGGILIPYDDVYIIDGATPSNFSPGDKNYIVSTLELLYKKHRNSIVKASKENLSGFLNECPDAIYRIVLDHFFFVNEEQEYEYSEMLTKDKKEFILLKSYYSFSDRDDIKRRILKIRGFRIVNEGEQTDEISWVNFRGMSFGEVYIADKGLIFLTNAREHLEKWKHLIKDIPLEFLKIEEIDQEEIIESLFINIEDDLFFEKPDDISTEQFRKDSLEEWDNFYNAWFNLKQPELGYKTPSKLIETTEGRQKVTEFIDSLENEVLGINKLQSKKNIENKIKYFNADELRKRIEAD